MEKLINAGNMKQLVEGMNYMLDHFEQYPAKDLRDYAIRHFSYEAVGRQFTEIYKGVIRK